MAEVEENDGDDLPMPGHEAKERLDFGCRDATGEKLLRILGEGVVAVEEAELALLPAVEDFPLVPLLRK